MGILRRHDEMNRAKVYVAVNADFTENGTMLPRKITWEDGTKYEIDRITNIRQAAAMKAGGQGDRYTVMITCTKSRCSQVCAKGKSLV